MKTVRPKIVMVDDSFAILSAGNQILRDHYSVYPTTSGEDLFALLQMVTPDLILLSTDLPDMNGYTVMEKLQADTATEKIPVIFMAGVKSPADERKGLALGGMDYIYKPFSPPLLRKRTENVLAMKQKKQRRRAHMESHSDLRGMVRKRTAQVVELQNAILNAMAELVEVRDSSTGGHIGRIQQYLSLLVNRIIETGIYRDEIEACDLNFLIPSSRLHDVGKIAISDAILNKPGYLTPEEFEIMKRHTIMGEEAIDAIMQTTTEKSFLRHAKIFAGNHHERWDGSGYPRGLRGLNIPLEGRMLAIVDVYDAIIFPRAYKAAMSTDEAERVIRSGRGTHFDPQLVDLFMDIAPQFAVVADFCRDHADEMNFRNFLLLNGVTSEKRDDNADDCLEYLLQIPAMTERAVL